MNESSGNTDGRQAGSKRPHYTWVDNFLVSFIISVVYFLSSKGFSFLNLMSISCLKAMVFSCLFSEDFRDFHLAGIMFSLKL